jgi:RNA polymerase sigma-70 factor (ECF subfamily)
MGDAHSERIDELYDAGRARFPDLPLARDAFAHHVARLPSDARPSLDHAPDLYLACACALGVAGAIEAFERTYANDLARTVARVNPDGAFVADAVQAVRERLLLARADAPPRIGEYAGRAALRAWLASAATRVAFDLRRAKSDRPHDELKSDVKLDVPATEPELAMLRARYKSDFEEALRLALRALPSRERAILRLHLAERTSIDGLATMYNVGRSTAARWLASAREHLLEKTREQFCDRVGLPSEEFDSVAAALRSDLDVSIIANLATRAE